MAKLYGSVSGQSKEIKTLYGSVNGQSKEIIKLYGSVNGQSKLIYEKASGVPYGIVYYKNKNTGNVESVELQSVAEFESLAPANDWTFSWTASVGGGAVTVESMVNNVIVGIEIGTAITTIPSRFLNDCIYFNWSFDIPNNITSIGDRFLYYCSTMVGTINVGSVSATVAQKSDYTFSAGTNNGAAYTTGITIAGANRAAWISRFPNKTSSPYRKLINAGY